MASTQQVGRNGARKSLVLLKRAVDYIPDIDAEAALPCVSTGLANLDRQLGGGLRCALISTLIAGTGRGKTSLALQIAAAHALRSPVVYYSAELTGAQLVARLIAQRTRYSWRQILANEIDPEEREMVLRDLNLYVIGRQANPLDVLRETTKHLAGLGEGQVLLVIDYAQLVKHAQVDMRLGVMSVVEAILSMTQESLLATLVLSQGNRSSARAMREGEGTAEEFIDAGGESSAIEQESANVMSLLYKPRDNVIEHEVTVAVSKARLNVPGKIGLRFHGPSGRWTELSDIPLTPADQDRKARILAELDRSAPKSRAAIHQAIGGRKQAVLDLLRILVDAGAVREVPGGGLLLPEAA